MNLVRRNLRWGGSNFFFLKGEEFWPPHLVDSAFKWRRRILEAHGRPTRHLMAYRPLGVHPSRHWDGKQHPTSHIPPHGYAYGRRRHRTWSILQPFVRTSLNLSDDEKVYPKLAIGPFATETWSLNDLILLAMFKHIIRWNLKKNSYKLWIEIYFHFPASLGHTTIYFDAPSQTDDLRKSY